MFEFGRGRQRKSDYFRMRITNRIYTRPEIVERFGELDGLFEAVAKSDVYEFTVFELFEQAIHGNGNSSLHGYPTCL